MGMWELLWDMGRDAKEEEGRERGMIEKGGGLVWGSLSCEESEIGLWHAIIVRRSHRIT